MHRPLPVRLSPSAFPNCRLRFRTVLSAAAWLAHYGGLTAIRATLIADPTTGFAVRPPPVWKATGSMTSLNSQGAVAPFPAAGTFGNEFSDGYFCE